MQEVSYFGPPFFFDNGFSAFSLSGFLLLKVELPKKVLSLPLHHNDASSYMLLHLLPRKSPTEDTDCSWTSLWYNHTTPLLSVHHLLQFLSRAYHISRKSM